MSVELNKRDWEFGDLLGVVLALFQERIGVMIGGVLFLSLVPLMCFVPAGLMFATAGVSAEVLKNNPDDIVKLVPAFVTGGVCAIVYLLTSTFLRTGWLSILLKISGGQPAPFSEFFSNANYFMNIVATSFLMGLVCGVGVIFLVIPGIFFAIKFSWAPFLVIDQNMGPIDAMKASWDMTAGFSTKILMAGAAYFVISTISGFIPFLGMIAQLLAMAFLELTLASLYRAKKGDLVPAG